MEGWNRDEMMIVSDHETNGIAMCLLQLLLATGKKVVVDGELF